jgi:hypothetical protein
MVESCWRCDCAGCAFCLTYDESVAAAVRGEDEYCGCPDPWYDDGDE